MTRLARRSISRVQAASTSASSSGDGQVQGFAQEGLRSRGHVAILDADGQPSRRLHPTAAVWKTPGGRG
jgi:hypothetical protein